MRNMSVYDFVSTPLHPVILPVIYIEIRGYPANFMMVFNSQDINVCVQTSFFKVHFGNGSNNSNQSRKISIWTSLPVCTLKIT